MFIATLVFMKIIRVHTYKVLRTVPGKNNKHSVTVANTTTTAGYVAWEDI